MNLNYFDEVASSTYTSLEKQSLYQLLCATMIIDGNSDSREMAHINKICRILGITSADMEASRRLTEPIMSNCIRNMDMLKKSICWKICCSSCAGRWSNNCKRRTVLLLYEAKIRITRC